MDVYLNNQQKAMKTIEDLINFSAAKGKKIPLSELKSILEHNADVQVFAPTAAVGTIQTPSITTTPTTTSGTSSSGSTLLLLFGWLQLVS